MFSDIFLKINISTFPLVFNLFVFILTSCNLLLLRTITDLLGNSVNKCLNLIIFFVLAINNFEFSAFLYLSWAMSVLFSL